MEQIHDKRIIITGASSGIGKSTALLLAEYGAKLVLVARNRKRLEDVRNGILKRYSYCSTPLIFPCDVSNHLHVKKMVKTCNNILGHIDILINNAGIGVYGEYTAHDINDFKRLMSVNFFGALYCIQEVLPFMLNNGKGQIINVASIAALHGIPYLSAYSASKAALVSVCQCLKAELSTTQIEIKIIYPGYTNTPFFINEKRVGNAVRPDDHYAAPEKVARNILRLICKKSGNKVLSFNGLKLAFLHHFMPDLLDKLLDHYAIRLKN